MEKILIDLKKLNKKLNYIFKTYGVSEVIKKKVYEAVEKSTIQPTIDPVKHGKWKYDEDVKALYCGCCGIFAQPQRKTNYCPHCGADMRGE